MFVVAIAINLRIELFRDVPVFDKSRAQCGSPARWDISEAFVFLSINNIIARKKFFLLTSAMVLLYLQNHAELAGNPKFWTDNSQRGKYAVI